MAAKVRIVPVTDAPWADVERVFGTRGDPAGCWCQFFKLPNAEWKTITPDDCRNLLEKQVQAAGAGKAHPPGVIAYLEPKAGDRAGDTDHGQGDDSAAEPAGWCAVEPRTAYDRLRTAEVVKGSAEDEDDDSVWAITCFVVRVGHRRQGIGGELLRGAIEQATRLGARVIEGYPVDAAGGKKSSAELYHGTLSQFLAAGFEVTSRPSPSRAVVTLRVTAPA
ncbi:GNAT family N-acetyltransferase [Leifsonia flava]|uniref:N-acetyltransferase n=1 Tax=Orlajensenia leifsoniae TaxID=2561933 RepID=A0A4Y9R3B7_9MICO|nr:GNAT family N-acetyltransferase [Leifsonia flava]TFV98767.1 N-acetyltransferase [Leifsonia flava]